MSKASKFCRKEGKEQQSNQEKEEGGEGRPAAYPFIFGNGVG